MLPDGLFDSNVMRKTKWKKLFGDDGVATVGFTIMAWVILFVLYILVRLL